MVKASNDLKEVDQVFIGLWKAFHFSPKKAAAFETIQAVYGQKPLKFIKACTTR
jgi:hypothetical protein